MGIPDILVNIMSCNVFSKYSMSTAILTCRSDLVLYYISKAFFIVETREVGLDNIPVSVKHQINADNLHPEDSLLTCKEEISSTINT